MVQCYNINYSRIILVLDNEKSCYSIRYSLTEVGPVGTYVGRSGCYAPIGR